MNILAWITGAGFKALAGQLAEWHIKLANAKNDAARIEAEQNIKQIEARQAVLIAEQKHASTRWIRPAFAAPFVIYLWKLLVWDKVLGWGATDDLSPELWKLFGIIIAAYFITRPFEKWLK